MPRITIIGAGMAGLLAANMLRRHSPVVLERQPELPNNHHAVLRFRSEEVSRALNIPFRRVQVFKSCDEADPVKAAILYARKVTGRYEVRSLIDLAPADRFIAPSDLVAQMAHGVDVQYGLDVDPLALERPMISTMPMSSLMDLLNYPGERPQFVSVPGWTVTAQIKDCDMFVTRYITNPHCEPYRISITGDQLIVEGVGPAPHNDQNPDVIALKAACTIGMGSYPETIGPAALHQSRYAKIGRLSSADRQLASSFMFWATAEHNIYSLGRFATWRAGLLLDDLVQDIRKIEGWMNSSPYELRKTI